MSKSKVKNRTSDPASDETDESNQASSSTKFDLSCLRQPVMTSITGFEEVLRAYEAGTDELRKLLSRECDLIYECKVCRNIFRSLTNFISHKRVYCRTSFNASEHFHFRQNGYQHQDISTIIEAEQVCGTNHNNGMLPALDDKSKDLSGIVERLLYKQHQARNANLADLYGEIQSTHDSTATSKSHTLKLDRVNDSGVAVYQSLQANNSSDPSSMRDEVAEVHKMMNKSNTVLGPDGKLLNLFASTAPNGHSSSGESKTCQVCFETFDTKKTLKLHLQLKHMPSTYLYQCPACPQKFSSSGAVMKHLSNEHNKNQRRIRLMRDNIIKNRVRADEVVPKKQANREVQKLASTNGSEGGQEDSEMSWNTNDLNGDYTSDSYTCPSCFKKFERKTVYTNHVLACSEAKCRENIKLKKQKAKEEAKIMKEAGESVAVTTAQQHTEPSSQEQPPKRKRKRTVKPKKEAADDVSEKAEESSSLVDWNLDDEEEKEKLENIKKEIIEDDYKRASTTSSANVGNVDEIKTPPVISNNVQQHLKVEEDDDDDDEEENALVIDEKDANDNDTSDSPSSLKCPQCEKVFDNQDKLNYHTTTFHSRQKRFKCKMCEYQGYRKKDTMNHLNYVHNIECDKEKLESLMESVMRAMDEESLAKQNELKRHQLKIKRRMERAKKRESKMQGGEKSTNDGASTSANGQAIPPPTHDDSPESALKLMFEPPPLVPIGSAAVESEFKYPPVILTPPVAKRDISSVPAKLRRKSLHTSVLIPPKAGKNEDPSSPLKIPKMFIKAATTSSSDESPEQIEKKKKRRSRGSPSDQMRPGQSLLDMNKFGKVVKRSSNGDGKEAQRPIRNRIKPVNKDFLYDLSDLLKKDADAYREHQVTHATTLPTNSKRELRKRAMSTHTRETPGLSSFDDPMSPIKTSSVMSPFKSPMKDEDDIPLMKIKEKQRRMSVFQPPTRPIFPTNTSDYSRSNSSNPNTGAAYKMALKEFNLNRASLFEPKFLWTICFDQNSKTSFDTTTARCNGGGSQISAASSILQRLSGRIESPISQPTSSTPLSFADERDSMNAPKPPPTLTDSRIASANGLIALALGTGNNVCVLQECDPDSDEDDDSGKPSSSDVDVKKTSKKVKRAKGGEAAAGTKAAKKPRKNSEKRKSGTNGQRRLTVMQRLQENKIRKSREQLFQRLIRDRQSNEEDEDDDDEEGDDQSSSPLYNLFSES